MNKLTRGRGNIVRQIENFRELGVQPSKRLDVNQHGLSSDDKQD